MEGAGAWERGHAVVGRAREARGRVGLWVVYRGSSELGRGCVEKQGCCNLLCGVGMWGHTWNYWKVGAEVKGEGMSPGMGLGIALW